MKTDNNKAILSQRDHTIKQRNDHSPIRTHEVFQNYVLILLTSKKICAQMSYLTWQSYQALHKLERVYANLLRGVVSDFETPCTASD